MIRVLLYLCFAVPVFGGVSTAKHYDNRKMPVLWSTDDMYGHTVYDDVRWQPYLDALDVCEEYHVVMQAAGVTGVPGDLHVFMGTTPGAWSEIRTLLANPYFMYGNHSYSHPMISGQTGLPDDYDADINYHYEYSVSQDLVQDNAFSVLERFRYKGQAYNVAFCAWGRGGETVSTGYNTNAMWSAIATNNYLYWRQPGASLFTDLTSGLEWDSGRGFFKTRRVDVDTTDIYSTTNEVTTYQGIFDAQYAAGEPFEMFNHVWGEYSNPKGVNSNIWANFFGYIGNKHDTWYTDYDSWVSYTYLQQEVPPTITEVRSNSFEYIFQVEGDPTERAKYGLSHPIAYVVDKPDSWADDERYAVSYSTNATDWSAVTHKTTNDWYNFENCYRDECAEWGETNVVIVNQALPEWSDTFYIRLRKRRMLPAMLGGG